jgi:ferritin-like metal-binding protein YciE
MTTVHDLNDLFVELLKDIYYAEKKILKALPKMAKAVGRESRLADAFETHREETEGQIERLEHVFQIIGQKARGKKCDAIEGISKEADEIMDEVENEATMAAGLLAGAQAVEHYEIARYGTLIEWAHTLGYDEAAELLEETLREEKKTNMLLNRLAVEGGINRRASDESQEDDHSNRSHRKLTGGRRWAA